jgi:hypothetical protein
MYNDNIEGKTYQSIFSLISEFIGRNNKTIQLNIQFVYKFFDIHKLQVVKTCTFRELYSTTSIELTAMI